MPIDRRSFLRLMLATAAAEAIDFEQLLWVPKPIITVPGQDFSNMGKLVAAAWESYVKSRPEDNIFDTYWLSKDGPYLLGVR